MFLWELCFIFIHLIHITTFAQPAFASNYCANAYNYTANSAYQRNLDTTLSFLPTTNNGLGFYNRSTGQGNDTVHSIALCRGDVNPDVCRSCLNDTIVKLRQFCPNQKEAIGYYDYCLLKYSNQNLLGNTGIRFYAYQANSLNASDIDQFNRDLRPLLYQLRGNASAGGERKKFATGSTSGPEFSTIYGLMQCTPDLSEQQCSDCLEGTINKIATLLNGKIGGRIYAPMCNLRYETYRFYNMSAQATPPPISQPSPPNTPLQQPPPPRGKKNNTTRTIIIVTIIVIIAIIITIASLSIIMRLMKKKKNQITPSTSPRSFQTDTTTMDIGVAESLQYDFTMVKAATNNFSEENKLRRGGFGMVYKENEQDARICMH